MSDSLNEQRDQLAVDAASYEERLLPGSTVDDDFECQHAGLAKTVRMLHAVFRPASESTPQAFDQPPPRLSQIGRFSVERCLGSGNFGSVWLGHDPVLKRDVAIKVAHIGVHARADLQERFAREAHLAARLHHPNIVPVFETDVDDGRLFIVSEYCDGQSLAQWLAHRDDQVEPLVAAELIRQLADAVDHAHRQGLIHRDIKPANVMLRVEDDDVSALVPRLMDFGLARDLTSETSSTRTGMLMGTTAYMSPEQASGDVKAQGAASDIFSLGVLLYRLLTGETPFSGQTDFEIIRQIINTDPVSPTRCRSSVPRDLSSICLKCLEKRPDRRYATAAELREDADRFLRGEPTAARPISAVERVARWSKRSPAAAALVFVSIASLAAIVAGMGVYLRQVERHAGELAEALQNARDEQAIARQARDEAEVSRLIADSQRERADNQRQLARATSYRSDMRLAFDLWERGRIHEVNEILARQDPGQDTDLRGPEWFALDADYRAKYRVIGNHEGGATECVLSRDASRAFTTGVDGFVRVWDVRSGEKLKTFHPNIGEIHALALSPDQATVAVGGKTWLLDLARVVLLDAETGEQRRTWQMHKTTIESIAFSPDGKWLAAGSRYQPVQLTRLSDGAQFTLPVDRRNRSVAFSPDSRLLSVVASGNHEIWRLDGEEPERVSAVGQEAWTPYVSSFAPSVPVIATAYMKKNFVAIFEPTRPVLLAMAVGAPSRSSKLTCVGFSPDAQFFAAGDDAGEIRVWKPNTKQLFENRAGWGVSVPKFTSLTTRAAHVSTVTSVAVTNEGTLVSSGLDGRVAVTVPSATGASHIRWKGIQVKASVLDGDELLLACQDGTIRRHVLDAEVRVDPGSSTIAAEDQMPSVLISASSPIRCLDLSPDGQLVAAGTDRGGVALYRRETGEIFRSLVHEKVEVNEVAVTTVSFSSKGQLLAFASEDGFVKVLDLESAEQVLSSYLENVSWTLRFLEQDQVLACGGGYARIRMLDLETGKLARSVAGYDTNSLNISPDGRWLASAHSNGTIQIFEALSSKAPRAIRGHREVVESVGFSATSQTLISLGAGGVVQFTNVQTGEVFGRLNRPSYVGRQFEHSQLHCSDQLLVAIGCTDDTVSDLYVWHIDQPREIP